MGVKSGIQGAMSAELATAASMKSKEQVGADKRWKLHQEISIENVLKTQQQQLPVQEQVQGPLPQPPQDQDQRHQTPDANSQHNQEAVCDKEANQLHDDADVAWLRQRVQMLDVHDRRLAGL